MKEKKYIITMCSFMMLTAAIISLGCGLSNGAGPASALKNALTRLVQTGTAEYIIMIDPGHGGMDGGASDSEGTLEKDINLAVAKKIAELAGKYDCAAVLTRETDEWLCETEEGSIRSRKTADLKARCEMIKEYKPDITVSIHLNSFKEDPGVKGAQVFYPSEGMTAINGTGTATSFLKTDNTEDLLHECKNLAYTMQQTLNENLQPDNPRTAMIRDGVFIFRELYSPVIIVECGFMSNPDEAEALKTAEYQQELAECIMDGIAAFAGLKAHADIHIIDSR